MAHSAPTSLELVRDFVNTLDVESRTDSLDAAWLAGNDLAGCSVAAAREIREAIRELLLANNHQPADLPAASATLDRAARRAGLSVRFSTRTGTGTASIVGTGGLGPVLVALAEAMRSEEWERLKACRAETCHWAFIDRARNRSRAWCSMSVCGNRGKARRFRERRARDA